MPDGLPAGCLLPLLRHATSSSLIPGVCLDPTRPAPPWKRSKRVASGEDAEMDVDGDDEGGTSRGVAVAVANLVANLVAVVPW